MNVQQEHHHGECIIVLTGDTAAADTNDLRGHCYHALSKAEDDASTSTTSGTSTGAPAPRARALSAAGIGGASRADAAGDRGGADGTSPRHSVDLLIDARAVTRFDDLSTAALTSTRTRVRHLGGHVVIIDSASGALSRSLQRTGLSFRFPRFDTPAEARACLARDRELRARMDTPFEAAWRRAR